MANDEDLWVQMVREDLARLGDLHAPSLEHSLAGHLATALDRLDAEKAARAEAEERLRQMTLHALGCSGRVGADDVECEWPDEGPCLVADLRAKVREAEAERDALRERLTLTDEERERIRLSRRPLGDDDSVESLAAGMDALLAIIDRLTGEATDG